MHSVQLGLQVGLSSTKSRVDCCPRGARRGTAGFPGLTVRCASRNRLAAKKKKVFGLEVVSLLPDLDSGDLEQLSMF